MTALQRDAAFYVSVLMRPANGVGGQTCPQGVDSTWYLRDGYDTHGSKRFNDEVNRLFDEMKKTVDT